MVLAMFAWSPIVVFGYFLFISASNENIAKYFDWWSPLARKISIYCIDEKYTKNEKRQIDGVILMAFGSTMTFQTLVAYFIACNIKIIDEGIFWIIYLFSFFITKILYEWLAVRILLHLEIVKY